MRFKFIIIFLIEIIKFEKLNLNYIKLILLDLGRRLSAGGASQRGFIEDVRSATEYLGLKQ